MLYFSWIFGSFLIGTISTGSLQSNNTLSLSLSNNTRSKRDKNGFCDIEEQKYYIRDGGMKICLHTISNLTLAVMKYGKINAKNTTHMDLNEPCMAPESYYNPKIPNFRMPGRRISEVKCLEYIWQRKVRNENYEKQKRCVHTHAVIGGRNSVPGEYPHMGALGWRSVDGSWTFKCGSTLISPRFTLTAAHCSKSPRDANTADPVPEIVRFGVQNIFGLVMDIQHNDAMISKIILHPRFRSPKKYYDIALIKLDREMVFWKNVQPACLWNNRDTSYLGLAATITGWGITDEATRMTPPMLQAAEVDILHSNFCNRMLQRACNRLWCRLAKHQLCAGKLPGGVDACQGDSGGPLQVKISLPPSRESPMYFVIGVTSFGIGCARPNLPGVYTRVSYFVDWIESIVWPDH